VLLGFFGGLVSGGPKLLWVLNLVGFLLVGLFCVLRCGVHDNGQSNKNL
jgi:hypothetical protein